MITPLSLLGAPWLQLFDENGAPASGYLLYTYIAGLDTLLPTYSDSDGSTLNSNPIELDIAGHAVVYLTPGIGYKFVLRTPAGALVWTSDNVVDMATLLFGMLISTDGEREAVTGYTIQPDDYFVTFDGDAASPGDIILPAAASRFAPITMKNVGANGMKINPDGTDTIEGVLTDLTVSGAVSPVFPTVTLIPGKILGTEDDNNTWWVRSTAGIGGGTLT